MNIGSLLLNIAETAFIQAGIGSYPVILHPAKNPQFGDYQINGVMSAAKQIQQNPLYVAKQVISFIDNKTIIDSVEVAGPGFINIRIKGSFLNQKVNLAIQDNHLHIQPSLAGERIVIDYSSPNLAKEMHVGHLRSTIIGDSLHRIYKFMGTDVIPQNHVGDWGTQFGMLIAYLIEQENKQTSSQFILSDLEAFYRQAKNKFDIDKAFSDQAREYVVKLQRNDPDVLSYWKKLVAVSTEHVQSIYQRLDVLLTESDILGESKYNDMLAEVVGALLEKGIAVDNDGTKLVYLEDLKDENNQPSAFIIQKQDKGYLYATTDLACLKTNIKEHDATRLIYVVDSRQTLHFKSLFNISKKAGWLPPSVRVEHVAFGMMSDSEGRPFKTRDGNTVKLGELLDEAVHRATTLIQEKNPTLSREDIGNMAQIVGIGAVKYADLSKNRLSDYMFDWNNMLSFEGNTAPYLQYAYVRIVSLMRKSGVATEQLVQSFAYQDIIEKQLAVVLLQFEEVLLQVVESSNPHYLASYLYQVATCFSRFYETCNILKAEKIVKLARLGLSNLAGQTLKHGLALLGIGVLNRM